MLMPRLSMKKQHHPTAWLWWLALFIVLVGGSFCYIFSLRLPDPQARTLLGYAAMFTVIGAGVCLICASSSWWLKR